MADDVYHPCQGVSDVMGMRQHKGDLRGKTLLMSWGHGSLARSYCSVQENMLLSSRMGMNVKLAHPKGYDLPKEITDQVNLTAKKVGRILNWLMILMPDIPMKLILYIPEIGLDQIFTNRKAGRN